MNSLLNLPLAGMPGGMELLVILFIVLLFFGGTKLPSLARGLGQSVREFKKASNGDEEEPKAEAKKAATAESTKTHGSN